MQHSISLLLSHRRKCGIPKENKYLFALVGTTKYARGSDAIRYCREAACCVYPERITATCLRKEAATLAKVAGLSELDVEELATFMGHTL